MYTMFIIDVPVSSYSVEFDDIDFGNHAWQEEASSSSDEAETHGKL